MFSPVSAFDCSGEHSTDQLFLSNDKDGNGRDDDHDNTCDHQGDGLGIYAVQHADADLNGSFQSKDTLVTTNKDVEEINLTIQLEEK